MTEIDFIIRLKNGAMAGKESVVTQYSVMSEKIAAILQKEGYITQYEVVADGVKKTMVVSLAYDIDLQPKLTAVKLFSKPGRRLYAQYRSIRSVQAGAGMAVITTSSGVMTDKEARKRKIGGELLFQIW